MSDIAEQFKSRFRVLYVFLGNAGDADDGMAVGNGEEENNNRVKT